MKKKLFILFTVLCAVCLILTAIFSVTGASAYGEDQKNYDKYLTLTEGENVAFIEVEGYGVITAVLYPEYAPITVANFKKLISENFYDGLIFHRVIKDFMIQGGDPKGNGTGGSEEEIQGEFKKNGWDNPLLHKRGVLSMARQGTSYDSTDQYYYNTASSQFFIMHKTTTSLDGKYASFGEVTDGMDIVDAIATVETNRSTNKPLEDVVIHTVTQDKEKLSISTPPSVVRSFLSVFITGALALASLTLAVLFFLRDKKEKAEIAARIPAEEEERRRRRAERKAMKEMKRKK